MQRTTLENVAIVLVGTKHPGNLGSAARAMWNMGLRDLRLVSPQCSIDEHAYRMARSGKSILEATKTHSSLLPALTGTGLVVGTTGKVGGNRNEVQSPRALAPQILSQASRQAVALVFGPEDTGLVDDDLLLCQMNLRIPTAPQARSMNLSQAVVIVTYELYLASLAGAVSARQRASLENIEAMTEHLQQTLLEIGFLHPKNERHMMFAIRRMLGRAALDEKDVAILRGIARQISWHHKSHQPD